MRLLKSRICPILQNRFSPKVKNLCEQRKFFCNQTIKVWIKTNAWGLFIFYWALG
jgi:hypothetical protein